MKPIKFFSGLYNFPVTTGYIESLFPAMEFIYQNFFYMLETRVEGRDEHLQLNLATYWFFYLLSFLKFGGRNSFKAIPNNYFFFFSFLSWGRFEIFFFFCNILTLVFIVLIRSMSKRFEKRGY